MESSAITQKKLSKQFLVYEAEWNVVKMNRSDSKLLNIAKVLLYIVSGRDIDRQKFCKYGWDNLFRKSSVLKECGDENLVVSKIAIEIYLKSERAKK
ncbi:hypothetical protein RhiirA5_421635 [Rhizophagus irregularis]|uniref:Uncharacterized protein n=1 Tax=Rhizophagus irregularis TaxID=588596 RepID=A0A2N0PDI5_9GLOM|nr:hypothetical protein RhiirA5_421635 [Rhizophagus irregularis]